MCSNLLFYYDVVIFHLNTNNFLLHRLKVTGQLTAVKPKDGDAAHPMTLQLAPNPQSLTSVMTPPMRLLTLMSNF